MPEDVWIALVLRVTVFIGCSCPLALLLHCSGLPGGRPAAALAGGILAGILLGPAVAGNLAPEGTEALFQGGQIEHKALLNKDLEHSAARIAMTEIGPSAEAMTELLHRQEQARAPFLDRFNEARARTHFLTASVMVGLVGLSLGAAAWAGRTPRTPAENTTGSVLSSVVIAISVLLFAGLPTVLILQWLLELPMKEMVAISAVVAAGSLFAPLALRWMGIAGRDPLTRVLGLFVSLGAAATLAWAIPPERLAYLFVPVVAVGIGSSLNLIRVPGRGLRQMARRTALWICMPACGAYLAREVDWQALPGSWQPITLVIIAALTAGAGHFIGCYLAIQTFGRDAARRRAARHAIELLASGIGLTQLCFAVVLFAALPDTAGSVVLAMLLANALAIEFQAPLNRRAIVNTI